MSRGFQVIGFLCFVFSIAIVVTIVDDHPYFKSKKEQFESVWKVDMAALRASQKLPKGFKSIRKVLYFGGTPMAKKWLKSIKKPFVEDPKGLNDLEVLVAIWTDQGQMGVLVQYDLIDVKSGNLVAEIARNFNLGDLDIPKTSAKKVPKTNKK